MLANNRILKWQAIKFLNLDYKSLLKLFWICAKSFIFATKKLIMNRNNENGRKIRIQQTDNFEMLANNRILKWLAIKFLIHDQKSLLRLFWICAKSFISATKKLIMSRNNKKWSKNKKPAKENFGMLDNNLILIWYLTINFEMLASNKILKC